MNNRGWLAAAAAVVFVFLISHSSSRPQVLWRYSYPYFAFLVAYVTFVLGLLWVSQSRYRSHFEIRVETLDLPGVRRFLATHHLKIVLLIQGLHVLLVFLFLPPQRVFATQPILEVDYAHHYHQVVSVVEALATESRSWAWDPSFCAGYPLGTLFDVDMKLFEVVAFAFARVGVNTGLLYNCLILMCFLSVPALLFFACRNFGIHPATTALSVLIGTLIWHSYGSILLLNSVGVCTFVFASYGSLLIVSLIHRVMDGGGYRSLLALVVTLSAGVMAHITMPLILTPPVMALYARHFSRLSWKRHGLLLLAATVALLANIWWIAVVLRFLHFRVITTFLAPPRPAELVAAVLRFESPGLLMGILGTAGYLYSAKHSKTVATMGVVSIVSFFVLSNMSLGIPLISTLEPLRFMIPMAVYSTLGIALGLSEMLKCYVNPIPFVAARPILFALALFAATILAPRSMFENAFRSRPDAFPPITAWIRENLPPQSRLAFQDDSPGTLSAARLRANLDLELIGGPFSEVNMKHSFAAFTRSRFFDKRFKDLTHEDVARYAELFNISSIITSTHEACLAFSQLAPTVRRVDKSSVYTLPVRSASSSASPFEHYSSRGGEYSLCFFEVDRHPSFFLEGSGRVHAELNRLEVTDSSSGRIVLKYHWLDGLATDPVLPIREHHIEGLPIGFIEVDTGSIADFTIYNSYPSFGSID